LLLKKKGADTECLVYLTQCQIFGQICIESGLNMTSGVNRELSIAQHIAEANKFLVSAENMDDPQCAIADAKLAEVHLEAAAIKMLMNLLGGKRPIGGAAVISILSKIAK
jgi:hypothetical protein